MAEADKVILVMFNFSFRPTTVCVCVCYLELDCLHDSHGLDDR